MSASWLQKNKFSLPKLPLRLIVRELEVMMTSDMNH